MIKKFLRSFLPLLFLLLINTGQLTAQTGTIRGKVTSAETGETLIGANVFLEGSTQGASTDLDGNFSIEDVDPGTYNLLCKFISFRNDTIKNIEVKAGEVVVHDFQLLDASVEMEEFTVEAKQRRNTSASMLAMKKKSAKMMDGISSEQISRNGDGNAASAVKRVSGISIEGGKYVYVRGLSDRYSKTMLNGAVIPGLDPERNTVQMDLFPTNLIENMTVVKAFSPDLPGSFTGGLVNIQTKDFPEKFTFQYSSSIGYNPQANLNPQFLGEKSSQTDWLGMDGGKRKLPSTVQGKVPALYENNETLTRQTQTFNKTFVPEEKGSSIDQNHSISIGDQVGFLGNSLGFVAGISYSKDHKYYGKGRTGRYSLTGSGSNESLNEELALQDERGEESVLWGALLNLSYKFNNNHKVNLNLMQNQNGNSTARNQFGRIPKDNNDPDYRFHTRTLSYRERSLSTGQIQGEHYLKDLGKLKVDWTTSYTRSKQNEPDTRFFSNTYILSDDQEGKSDTTFQINPSEYRTPSRFYRFMEEDNFDARLNLEIPLKLGKKDGKLKFGGSNTRKLRTFQEKRFQFASQQLNYQGDPDQYFSDENMEVGSSNGYIYLQNVSEKRNQYSGSQNILSGYSMIDFYPLEKLRVVTGARVENTDISARSADEELDEGRLQATDILPAFQSTFSLKENMNLRFGYNRSIARPTFRELAPYASFQFVGDYTLIGNNDLDRTLIDNFDLRWEAFPRIGEIISFSVFAKDFKNPIEKVFNPQAANDELTYSNVDNANLYGVEFEIHKKLDQLSRITKDLSIGLNLTYVYSRVSIDSSELANIRATDPDHPDQRVMFGQSPYIVNSFLNYNNDTIGLRANLSFNVSGPKMVVVVKGGTPNIFAQPTPNLDLSLGKDLGDCFILKFKVRNLLNPRNDQIYTFNEDDHLFQSYRTGTSFSLGITYQIQ